IRTNEKITEFYPFKFHKNQHWSLEHIHAQNSQSLDRTKREQWEKWLFYHKILIEEISLDNPKDTESLELQNILSEIQLYKEEKLTWEIFERLSQKIIAIFSEQNDTMI